MDHHAIVETLVTDARSDPNTLGFLLFGSVASGTHRPDSDIDTITVLHTSKPASGMINSKIDGIKVGNIFFTFDILAISAETVPYLLHPLASAKILLDRDGSVEGLLDKIDRYFEDKPALLEEWNEYYRKNKEEKAEFGYEKTTIVDVWNQLEKAHSGGRIRRKFFNSFYMTNSWVFGLLKKLMIAMSPPPKTH
jgi:predicted nucleotidyltransferase